jgi:hypothetical protein
VKQYWNSFGGENGKLDETLLLKVVENRKIPTRCVKEH